MRPFDSEKLNQLFNKYDALSKQPHQAHIHIHINTVLRIQLFIECVNSESKNTTEECSNFYEYLNETDLLKYLDVEYLSQSYAESYCKALADACDAYHYLVTYDKSSIDKKEVLARNLDSLRTYEQNYPQDTILKKIPSESIIDTSTLSSSGEVDSQFNNSSCFFARPIKINCPAILGTAFTLLGAGVAILGGVMACCGIVPPGLAIVALGAYMIALGLFLFNKSQNELAFNTDPAFSLFSCSTVRV